LGKFPYNSAISKYKTFSAVLDKRTLGKDGRTDEQTGDSDTAVLTGDPYV
jgi:hypothetical protein